MSRLLAIILFLAAAITCVVSGVLWFFDVIETEEYALVAGIAGSFASIIGLLAFRQPSVTREDILKVEAELLGNLADSSKRLAESNNNLEKTQTEIERLQSERDRIEYFTRRAALRVFLEERQTQLIGEIGKNFASDGLLVEQINDYRANKDTLRALGAEEKTSDFDDIIEEVIGEYQSQKKPPRFEDDPIGFLAYSVEVVSAAAAKSFIGGRFGN